MRLLILALFALAVSTQSQTPQQLANPETIVPVCENGPALVRSPVLRSPNNAYQAYVENEAAPRPYNQCINTAKLFVKGPADEQFQLVYLKEPQEGELVSVMTLVDWSPDSHNLLLDLFVSTIGSDTGTVIPVIYDAERGVFSEHWVERALSQHFGRDCSFLVHSMGFAAGRGYVLKIEPTFESDDTAPDPDSCVQKPGPWLFDFVQPKGWTIQPLDSGFQITYYGRFAAAP
jgi:hypothetical protein